MVFRFLVVAGLCATLLVSACGGDEDPADDSESGSRAEYCPKHGPDDYDANQLVGLDTKAANADAKMHGCSLRVVEEDGEPLLGTSDLRQDRINVEVRDGKIVRIDGIY